MTALLRRVLCSGGLGRKLKSNLNVHYNFSNNMKAYIWYTLGEPQFKCILKYSDEALNIKHTFNFNRSSTENVGAFMRRVSSSVEKVVKTATSRRAKKKKKVAVAPTEEMNIVIAADLLISGQLVSAEKQCTNLLEGNEKLTLQLMGQPYEVVINSPWITNLSIPTTILSDCPIYPNITADCTNIKDSAFVWYKSQDSKTWDKVGEGFTYTPSKEDIGYLIKLECEPMRDSLAGPKASVISLKKIDPYPGPCPFEQRHAFTAERVVGNSFRVVSYNTLANVYADTETARMDLFRQCPSYALEISYRKLLLIKEIEGYQGDLICLQEVDKSVFEADLEPLFVQAGYDCIHNCKRGAMREGLACFVNKDRFQIESSSVVLLAEYFQLDPDVDSLRNKLVDNHVVSKYLSDKNTVLQTCILRSVDHPKEIIVVGNTHLFSNATADHIRLLQAELAFTRLRAVFQDVQAANPDCRASLICCGDFNSTPECGVFRLATQGNVPADAEDWRSREDELVEGVELRNPLKMDSACGTPEFTNYTIDFKGCLDYIFIQTGRFEVKQVVPLPSEEELKVHTALPSVVSPSDHIALIADLAWTP